MILEHEGGREQRLARPNHHLPARGVQAHHEQRVADGDVEAPPLANGVAADAVVTAEHAKMVMRVYQAADLSAETGNPVDLTAEAIPSADRVPTLA